MTLLTDEEVASYIKPRNPIAGVDEITEERLRRLDLDVIPRLVRTQWGLEGAKGQMYHYDSFTPRAGSYAFKPSFAGRQVLLGRVGRKLYFSDGRWFDGISAAHPYWKMSKEEREAYLREIESKAKEV